MIKCRVVGRGAFRETAQASAYPFSDKSWRESVKCGSLSSPAKYENVFSGSLKRS